MDGIVLLSEAGPTVTIIDGEYNARVIKIWQPCVSRSTVITGFTITHGYAVWFGVGSCGGGGISCNNGSSPILSDNIIIANEAEENGGGICCWYSNALIQCNLIQGNTDGLYYSNGGGGGIYAGSADVIGNVITGNSTEGYSYHAGGIGYGAILADNIITDNCEGHPAVSHPGIMENCIVSNNNGGSILMPFSGYIIEGCEISGNDDYGLVMWYAVGDQVDRYLQSEGGDDTTYVTNCIINRCLLGQRGQSVSYV